MADATAQDVLTVIRSQVPERLVRFAEEWARTPDDPARAAAAVGAPGQAAAFLKDPRVAKAYCAIIDQNRETFKDLRVQTIYMLAMIATADPAELFIPGTNFPRMIHEIPPAVRPALNIKVREGVIYEMTINAATRLRALELLLAHFGDISSRAYAPTGQAQVIFRGRSAR